MMGNDDYENYLYEKRLYEEELIRKTINVAEAKFKAYTILKERRLPIPPSLRYEFEYK